MTAPDVREMRKSVILGLTIAALTAGHFGVSTATHPQHVIHVLFQALYLLPVIGGAIWFGCRGGVATSLAVGAAYSLHILQSWPDQAADNVNQVAMIVVFIVVGVVAGLLVDLQQRERQRGVEAERRAQREAIIQELPDCQPRSAIAMSTRVNTASASRLSP